MAVCANARRTPSPAVPTTEPAHWGEYKKRPRMNSLTLKQGSRIMNKSKEDWLLFLHKLCKFLATFY